MTTQNPLAVLRRNWRIFARTTANEVRSRYAGSVLGLFWMVLAPLLLLAIYSVIYLAVFKVRPADMTPEHYVLYVLSGLLPFLAFSEGIAAGSASLTSNRAILLSTVFPAELVPLRAVIASQAPSLIGVGLCVAAAAALGLARLSIVVLPLVWLLLLLFVIGVAWVLALASLLVKDVQQALGFVNMVLLIGSPIAYTISAAPPSVRPWLRLNPLAHYIEAMHDCIAGGTMPQFQQWAVMIAISFASFTAGAWLFGRAKRALFDYA
jgi:lipopolysaccharide transport system permease protein